MKKKATVLMPVYNSGTYLEEAIESVLQQDYYEYDLLVINDGSEDNSGAIIRSFDDPRISYLENSGNQGLSVTLNRGLSQIESEYIIRMDADDISLPGRFGKQIALMESQPDIGLTGTWFEEFGTGEVKYCFSDNDQRLKTQLLYTNPVGHPTVIFRRALLNKFKLKYNPRFKFCEDYEFWPRCAEKFPITNIQEVLLNYRRHEKQVSTEFALQQQKEAIQVQVAEINKLLKLSPSNKFLYQKMLNKLVLTAEEQLQVEQLFGRLRDENFRAKLYDPIFFDIALMRISTYSFDEDMFNQ